MLTHKNCYKETNKKLTCRERLKDHYQSMSAQVQNQDIQDMNDIILVAELINKCIYTCHLEKITLFSSIRTQKSLTNKKQKLYKPHLVTLINKTNNLCKSLCVYNKAIFSQIILNH